MPPKKQEKKKGKRETVRIDADKHAEALKAIEEEHRQSALRHAAEAAEAEEAEEEGSEEEAEEDEKEEEIWTDIEPSINLHKIDLSFPETREQFENSEFCFPLSYYTISLKERCLLLYVENFRKQFFFNYPKRRPLMLAPLNECDVQKFVCTTIRPTGFAFMPLIGDVQGIADFVADFIIYKPLDDPYQLPAQMVSPDTLLRRRRGHSFEMASLLCSMLIGTGISAFVVSGIAREDILNNYLEKLDYPYEIPEIDAESKKRDDDVVCGKYKLRPFPDLLSHLEEHMQGVDREKEEEEARLLEEAAQRERELEELRPVDRFHYRRTHAWVVVIDNAPWSGANIDHTLNEEASAQIRARFIEPASGFICDTHCKDYIVVDSVWSDSNYWVNLQTYQRVDEIKWDLRDTTNWEHLLAAEPPEMQVRRSASDENLADQENNFEISKHLAVNGSWVRRLHIGVQEFYERFPLLEKSIRYKRMIEDRYSPYTQGDGKVKQITIYEDDAYFESIEKYSFYENRSDLLQMTKYNYETDQLEEAYADGRKDSLKYMRHIYDSDTDPKFMRFYAVRRIDSIKTLHIYPLYLKVEYENRRDLIQEDEFEFKEEKYRLALKKAVEKYARNPEIPTYKDIAIRTFNIAEKKYFLQFHYARGALTANTREFIKPPRPDYGKELKYHPSYTKAYKSNVLEPDPTQLELYRLLKAQIAAETKVKKRFKKLMAEIEMILENKSDEQDEVFITFDMFDPLRNGGARAQAIRHEEEIARLKQEAALKPPDFLAPYLIMLKGRQITTAESNTVYKQCLKDTSSRYISLLNELQRQYEELSAESRAIHRFLDKFGSQFNDYDYQNLSKQAKEFEVNKRTIQLRITAIHEEAQIKYDEIKESLLQDPRLCLDLKGEK